MSDSVLSRLPRVSAGVASALGLFLVYVLTLAPDVTFWDAGEFIAAAHSLGIPHPPGTPLFVLLTNAWAKLLPLPYATATNLFSAASTALAVALSAGIVQRATGSRFAAAASAIAAGSMSSVWLNATETEVYAASLTLGLLMIWAAERAAGDQGERWTVLTAYLIGLAVPLHLSALVAAPVAVYLASYSESGLRIRRLLVLGGAFVFAIGAGRASWWMAAAGTLVMLGSFAAPETYKQEQAAPQRRRALGIGAAAIAVAALAVTALAFLYVRAQFDPETNQGNPDNFQALVDQVARRQYAVSPIWPRQAPLWVQLGNVAQYADWQVALSLGPTVLPSILRTMGTFLFLWLGYEGAIVLWRSNRRAATAIIGLLACGLFGVMVYLNLNAGPSIGFGILPPDTVREARERDYFFVFGFWAWGMLSGIGAVSLAARIRRPAWTAVVLACVPVAMNWRAVTRRTDPEQSLPRAVAEGLLGSAPSNGVLFVVGDNDSYPLWYAQRVLGVRRDVTVVTIPLLPTGWYRRQIADRSMLLTTPEVEKYEGRAATAKLIAAGARRLGRPVVTAMTMTPRERHVLGPSWIARGLVYVEQQSSDSVSIDSAAMGSWAAWVRREVPEHDTRAAIDPVNTYFRRLLDCPRQFADYTVRGDSTALDSVCNYR